MLTEFVDGWNEEGGDREGIEDGGESNGGSAPQHL